MRINLIYIILLLFGGVSCSNNAETMYKLPPIPKLPDKRKAAEPLAFKKATNHGMNMAESQYCFCLRNSEKSTWGICEKLADEKMGALLLAQQDKSVQKTMSKSYVETKNRCKLQFGLIDALPEN